MAISLMKSGEKIRVLVPSGPLAHPYDTWNMDWVSWVRAMSGTIATLTERDDCDGIWGWKVATNLEPQHGSFGRTMKWIPDAWIIPAIPTSITPSVGIGYCVACSGVGKHRLMCPLTREKT